MAVRIVVLTVGIDQHSGGHEHSVSELLHHAQTVQKSAQNRRTTHQPLLQRRHPVLRPEKEVQGPCVDLVVLQVWGRILHSESHEEIDPAM